MMMFLTDDELWEMTDYRTAAKQIEWLKSNRYPFEVSAKGRPRVLRDYVVRRLDGKVVRRDEPKLRLG